MPLIDPVIMSTPTRPAGDAKNKLKDGAPPLQPVVLFGTTLARAADGLELLFLAAGFPIYFGSLVSDPVSALKIGVAALAVLQALWAVLCCPPLGYKKGVRPGFWPAILSLAFAALTVPLLHIIFVLFGAPLLNFPAETLLCATTLAVLSVFPIFYAHGVDTKAWRAVCSISAPLDETSCGFWGGIAGAWLGAVPIPLDWDRQWQRWPVTIVSGMVGGYVIGRIVGGVATFGAKSKGRGLGEKGDRVRSKEE
ncbi:related to Glycosylphosphatidylinositol anchor biosynthesis protein 11 [Cephalotrichum gorgonifer]|uniref:Related to Glycosylphosphatidylinositol anchor biosynthesis protein 11 n=1 Tax=Cephalotrichum gorgonifer TaxID=2041049 RepID=A0AAE8MQ13_9PEZI|nr:related to Glycosylphosphatidylinositol anchor biosynthesis protein 11 [Cephalotrichum gorgonifer]